MQWDAEVPVSSSSNMIRATRRGHLQEYRAHRHRDRTRRLQWSLVLQQKLTVQGVADYVASTCRGNVPMRAFRRRLRSIQWETFRCTSHTFASSPERLLGGCQFSLSNHERLVTGGQFRSTNSRNCPIAPVRRRDAGDWPRPTGFDHTGPSRAAAIGNPIWSPVTKLSRRKSQLPLNRLKAWLLSQGVQEWIGFEDLQARVS